MGKTEFILKTLKNAMPSIIFSSSRKRHKNLTDDLKKTFEDSKATFDAIKSLCLNGNISANKPNGQKLTKKDVEQEEIRLKAESDKGKFGQD